MNRILDTWRSYWELRGPEDSEQENYTFSGDPLRFWWLAKLYLILSIHQQQSLLEAVDLSPDNHQFIASDAQRRLKFQSKILSWLLQCRQEDKRIEQSEQRGTILCRIMKRCDDELV